MGLKTYAIKKILIGIPLIIGVMTFNFILIHLAPGGPLASFASPRITPQARQVLIQEFGLEKPIFVQYYLYLFNVFHGNLGQSYFWGEPVSALIVQRLPATILLTGTSTVLAILLGVPLGVLVATKPRSKTDRVITGLSILGYSMPVFWLGLIFLVVFAGYFRVLPSGGMLSLNNSLNTFAVTPDLVRHMILPVMTLTIVSLAPFILFTRAGMIEALSKDYVLTAMAKGAGRFRVLYKHALRNGFLSVFTVFGLSLAFVVAGSVLVETVFSWPGIGLLLYQAISYRDYPVLLGSFLIIAISVFIINLVTDIIYAFLDPRISYD